MLSVPLENFTDRRRLAIKENWTLNFFIVLATDLQKFESSLKKHFLWIKRMMPNPRGLKSTGMEIWISTSIACFVTDSREPFLCFRWSDLIAGLLKRNRCLNWAVFLYSRHSGLILEDQTEIKDPGDWRKQNFKRFKNPKFRQHIVCAISR